MTARISLRFILVLLAGISLLGLPSVYAGRQPTIPVYPGSLEAAVEAATRVQASVPTDATFSVQVINQVGGWVFGTSGVMPAADDDMPNLLLFLAEQRTNGWAVAIEYTDFFRTALTIIPRNLLTAEQWTTLSPTTSVALQGDGSLQLALPWAVGETQYLTGGPHAPGGSTVWGALDFAGGSGIVRAARSGTVYTKCSGIANDYVRIDHGGGLSTHYYHLANVRVTNGQWVGLWTELGQQSTSARCLRGSATGAHVHFWVTLNGQVVDIHGKDIGGWTVSRGSDQYQGCMTQVHNTQVQRCTPGNNAIKNEGWIGSGYAVGQGSDRVTVFGEAYNRNGGVAKVGYPTEPVKWRGTTTNKVTAQYFDGGSYGPSVLIHDRNNDPDHLRGAPAYLLRGRILHHYHTMGAWDSWLGPPTSDEFINKDGKIQQNFRYGFLIWHGGDHIEEGRWPAPLDGEWYVEYRNYVHDVWNFLMGPTWVENRFSRSCWGMEAPGSGPNERRWGVWSDYFNVRWSGRFYFEDGIYRFRARADDLIRIWFDGTRIIDDSDPTPDLGEYTADVRVNAGYHQVVVEYVEMPTIACAEFSWIKITSAVGEGSDRVSVFQQAYNRHGGAQVLGYPTGPVTWRGSTNRVLVQEFNHGTLGPLVMVHDRPNDEQFRGAPAYIIRGDIWQHYNSMGAWDSWLGPPTSDEFINADEKPQQNFRNGMLIWHGPGNIEARRWPQPQDGQWYIEYRNYVNNEVWNFQMGPTWVENQLSSTCWGDNAPGSGPNAMRWGVWPDYFTVRWSGRFYFEEGLYRFRARADDSLYLRVDWDTNWEQSLVITDRDSSRVNEEYTAERWMSAGYHTVLVEFIEFWSQACTDFSWTKVSGGSTPTTQPTATSTPSPTTTPTTQPTATSTPSPTTTPTPSPTVTPSPSPTTTATPEPGSVGWTVMLYLNGDNELHYFLSRAIARLEAQPAKRDVKIVVMLDGPSSADTRLFVIQPGGKYTTGVNEWNMNEQNMGDPWTLTNFIKWSRKNYPARYYYLALTGHGDGIVGMGPDRTNQKDYLTPVEIGTALKNATDDGRWQIDVLHYDACLMALIEPVYQVHRYVKYLVASQDRAFSVYAYDRLFPDTTPQSSALDQVTLSEYGYTASNETITPEQLARRIASQYINHPEIVSKPRTVSVLNAQLAPELVQAVDRLGSALRTNLSTYEDVLDLIRATVQKFDSVNTESTIGVHSITEEDDYVDLYHLAQHIYVSIPDNEVRSAAQQVMELVQRIVVVSEYSNGTDYWNSQQQYNLQNVYGLSIYFLPKESRHLLTQIRLTKYLDTGLLFTKDSQWDEFLQSYIGTISTQPDQDIFDVPQMLLPEQRVFVPLIVR